MQLAALWLSLVAGVGIEMHQGAVIGAANILGMGGAYIGIAEGSGGQLFNPAAVANRSGSLTQRWVDWDFSLDYLRPTMLSNHTSELAPSAVTAFGSLQTQVFNGTLNLLLGRLGLGLIATSQSADYCRHGVRGCASTVALYRNSSFGLGAGYAFAEGALTLALGVTAVSATFAPVGDGQGHRYSGLQGQAGLLFSPPDRNLRLGLMLRGPATLVLPTATEVLPITAPALPRSAHVPWRLGLGAAWSLGERPMNRPVTFAAGGSTPLAPPSGWFRDARVDVDLVLEGPSAGSISVNAWAAQLPLLTGLRPTLAVRVGLDSEFWPFRMRGRLGSYFEPSRNRGVGGRLHGTLGADLRLFQLIWQWRLGVACDLAQRYLNSTLSIGLW